MSRPGDQPNKERGLAQLKEMRDMMRDIVIEMVERREPVGWVDASGVISIARPKAAHLTIVGPVVVSGYSVRQFVRTMPGMVRRIAAPDTFKMPTQSVLKEVAQAVAFLSPDEIGQFPFDEESEHTDVFSLLLCEDPILFQHEQRHAELGQVAVRWLVFPKVTLRGADERGPSKMVVTTHSFDRDFLPRRLVIPSSVPPDVTISMRVGLMMVEDDGTPVSMFSERALGMAKTYPVLRAGVSLAVEVCNPTPGWVEFTSVIVGIEPVVAGVTVLRARPSAADAATPPPAQVVAERWPEDAPPEPLAATEGPPVAAGPPVVSWNAAGPPVVSWNEPVAELERRMRAEMERRLWAAVNDPTIPEMVAMGQIVPTAELAAAPPVVEGRGDQGAEGEEDGAPPA